MFNWPLLIKESLMIQMCVEGDIFPPDVWNNRSNETPEPTE